MIYFSYACFAIIWIGYNVQYFCTFGVAVHTVFVSGENIMFSLNAHVFIYDLHPLSPHPLLYY